MSDINQKRSRMKAIRRGTNGRQEHKGGAGSSHKNTGGKMAR